MLNYSKDKKGNSSSSKNELGTIKCDEYSDYRLIDTYEFHSQLRQYLRVTILEDFERKIFEVI